MGTAAFLTKRASSRRRLGTQSSDCTPLWGVADPPSPRFDPVSGEAFSPVTKISISIIAIINFATQRNDNKNINMISAFDKFVITMTKIITVLNN